MRPELFRATTSAAAATSDFSAWGACDLDEVGDARTAARRCRRLVLTDSMSYPPLLTGPPKMSMRSPSADRHHARFEPGGDPTRSPVRTRLPWRGSSEFHRSTLTPKTFSGDLDLGLVRVRVDQKVYLFSSREAVGLLRDHRSQQDVAGSAILMRTPPQRAHSLGLGRGLLAAGARTARNCSKRGLGEHDIVVDEHVVGVQLVGASRCTLGRCAATQPRHVVGAVGTTSTAARPVTARSAVGGLRRRVSPSTRPSTTWTRSCAGPIDSARAGRRPSSSWASSGRTTAAADRAPCHRRRTAGRTEPWPGAAGALLAVGLAATTGDPRRGSWS